METGRASETARLSAVMRAAHLVLDARPSVFEDRYAAPFAGCTTETALCNAIASFQARLAQQFSPELAQSLLRHIRSDVTLRARYVEDELADAVARGVTQYVILGAGFDSFAHRRHDLADALHVYEVDFPATLRRKQAKLVELGVRVPRNVTYVPLDFEERPVLEGLRLAGYRIEEPAFFSWLGVIWYLSDEAISETLTQLASAAPGSEVVLEYAVPEELLDAEQRRMLSMISSLAAGHGEPTRTELDPVALMGRMKELGFTAVWDLDADEINARYLAGRTDDLRFPGMLRLLKARLGVL